VALRIEQLIESRRAVAPLALYQVAHRGRSDQLVILVGVVAQSHPVGAELIHLALGLVLSAD
jgi:hypothetical protein